ncbi:MAG: hypothetical protein ACU843_10900 [Gammaproteobacteria bacterium]
MVIYSSLLDAGMLHPQYGVIGTGIAEKGGQASAGNAGRGSIANGILLGHGTRPINLICNIAHK